MLASMRELQCCPLDADRCPCLLCAGTVCLQARVATVVATSSRVATVVADTVAVATKHPHKPSHAPMAEFCTFGWVDWMLPLLPYGWQLMVGRELRTVSHSCVRPSLRPLTDMKGACACPDVCICVVCGGVAGWWCICCLGLVCTPLLAAACVPRVLLCAMHLPGV
jgi:hypothetical protein